MDADVLPARPDEMYATGELSVEAMIVGHTSKVHVQCMYSACTVHVLHLGGNALIKKAQSQEMQRFQAIPPETDSKDALALTLFFSTLFSSTR
jgi:hypothetical protein